MSAELELYYGNKANVLNELALARKTFGNVNTTEEQWEAMDKSLGLCYLYCPEEMMGMVQATMTESSTRKMHFHMNVWK